MKALIFGFLVLVATQSYADMKAFHATEFDQQIKSVVAVVISAHAPGCPTCRAQKPILKELSSQ
ncbi:thioredoxin family protein [Methylophilus medardicus]|uniref:Thioredoxin family protein n=1 Tax=Methylophilus medardicus TaxID=2588534 RepID=A0A5B8CVB1_9PROT|nr:thioredoxin family protein [Methylophilus medardicus]QDC45006.1 thioredoxin family protein [Methylophilus medardicus]QDC50013.1 thioredoxin family protein [Methylophilus medardicus]QDC53718.1 thioredoxin family protein [Methylophilus medardicus]